MNLAEQILTSLQPDKPPWLTQMEAVQSGQAEWANFSFEDRTCKGWLTPWLWLIESQFTERWAYWIATLSNGQVFTDRPIPRISFAQTARQDKQAISMLNKCLTHHSCLMSSASLPQFFEWLLWGFGEGEERPRINEKVNEHWYRTFNLGLMLQTPYDYLGDLISDAKSGSRWNNPNAFFPTPHNIVKFMVQMQFEVSSEKHHGDITASVMDPCVGTGRMLLEASNYSLNLYGTDIDQICVNACKINGYLYAPWMVKSAPWLKSSMPETQETPKQHQRVNRRIQPNKSQRISQLKESKTKQCVNKGNKPNLFQRDIKNKTPTSTNRTMGAKKSNRYECAATGEKPNYTKRMKPKLIIGENQDDRDNLIEINKIRSK